MKLFINAKRIGFLIIVLSNIGCNAEYTKKQDKPDYINKIDSLMRTSYERDLFNGNVLVAKNDTIVYQKSFGFTDGTQQTELDSKSVFNIGSIAKQFNGVAIMMLQERGLLNINDTISKFDLGLPDWSKKVTISHLLNYAGGIPRIDPIEPSNDEEAWKVLRSIDTLLFEPGTSFTYDNSNVFLQRRIIEKVTGQSFNEFILENIVHPLKMTNSVFDPAADYPNRTSCYDFDKVQCPEMEFIAGWLWVDINDLYNWINAMNSNVLISQESFNTLLINPYAKDKTSSIGEYFEQEQLQRHNGTSYKFASILLNDFKNDVVIILQSNNSKRVLDISYVAHDIMLGKEFEIPKKSIFQALENYFVEDVGKGIAAYNNLKQKHSEVYNFDDPVKINRFGYGLFRLQKNIDEAIKFFKFAVSQFPNNANLHDSLAEMYFNNEQYDLALNNYKKAIALGGTKGNAKMMIEKTNNILNK